MAIADEPSAPLWLAKLMSLSRGDRDCDCLEPAHAAQGQVLAQRLGRLPMGFVADADGSPQQRIAEVLVVAHLDAAVKPMPARDGNVAPCCPMSSLTMSRRQSQGCRVCLQPEPLDT